MDENPPPLAGTTARSLTETDVLTFLTAQFGGMVEELTRVGHGEWSTAFAFRRAGEAYVVRFAAHRDDFDKDRLATRYASSRLPIPAVIDIGEAFGGYYAVSERATGVYIDDLDGDGMRALLPDLFATLDAAREADVTATRGYGAWGADGVAPYPSWRAALLDVAADRPGDRTSGWRDKLAGSAIGPGLLEDGLDHLARLVRACPEERHLIHGDLLNYNVLVDRGRIAAVIDWGCGMYGDFLYDVAWFAYWAPWYPAWDGIDFAGEAARHYAAIGLAVPRFAERMRCYQVHIGLAGLVYRAFKEDWAEVERRGRRVLAIATQHAGDAS